ncbi:hypothetical protein E2C01_043754 [Portunus trituberculatus]|uniref:Uncharacterized protein n=1 Tax=Portunus trituberculatus TaxID=210409 RepID=A0A5B7FXK2_PORTR|nr:hypothetical protein [Portunus trituberculatus]
MTLTYSWQHTYPWQPTMPPNPCHLPTLANYFIPPLDSGCVPSLSPDPRTHSFNLGGYCQNGLHSHFSFTAPDDALIMNCHHMPSPCHHCTSAPQIPCKASPCPQPPQTLLATIMLLQSVKSSHSHQDTKHYTLKMN